jgi:tetratricopeptide (TPR) repeat protein
VTYLDEGKYDDALKEFDAEYAIARKINDTAAMAGDLASKGNTYLESGSYGDALDCFERSLALIKGSHLAPEVKENAELIHHYNVGRVALAKSDFSTAEKEAQLLAQGAEAKGNKNQIRLVHEVAGTIALERKQYGKAIDELKQASLLNPYNLYRLALAYEGIGNHEEARKSCAEAAHFNVLPLMNYAFIRQKAERMLYTL